MKIAFFGLPIAALLLLEHGYHVVSAAIPFKKALGLRRLSSKLQHVWVQPSLQDASFITTLQKLEPDLIVSWYWTNKIPTAILNIPPLGAVGFHPSLLPKHRGPDPFFWVLDQGDPITGVTAHGLEEDYDTGDIFGSKSIPIDPTWNAWALAKRLDRVSLALMLTTMTQFSAGLQTKKPQNHNEATEAPFPEGENLVIRWSWPTEHILRRIRALSPWPGASTNLASLPIRITKAEATSLDVQILNAGEAMVCRDLSGNEVVVIKTSDGAIVLESGYLDIGDEESCDLISKKTWVNLVKEYQM